MYNGAHTGNVQPPYGGGGMRVSVKMMLNLKVRLSSTCKKGWNDLRVNKVGLERDLYLLVIEMSFVERLSANIYDNPIFLQNFNLHTYMDAQSCIIISAKKSTEDKES